MGSGSSFEIQNDIYNHIYIIIYIWYIIIFSPFVYIIWFGYPFAYIIRDPKTTKTLGMSWAKTRSNPWGARPLHLSLVGFDHISSPTSWFRVLRDGIPIVGGIRGIPSVFWDHIMDWGDEPKKKISALMKARRDSGDAGDGKWIGVWLCDGRTFSRWVNFSKSSR